MDNSTHARDVLREYTASIDAQLQDIFTAQSDILLYKQLGYFMGFFDEALNPSTTYGGKRFRPGLTLMLADWYGAKELGVSAALSIELFHNFTLIHDDIVDGDTLRRGRPTVWKLFGVDHAINSGDAQCILSLATVMESEELSAEQKVSVQTFLMKQYLKVIEGQYADFILTKAPLGDTVVTQDAYLDMVAKKTADLVAAATTVSGIVSGKDSQECEALFSYGYNLGIAYQLYDDVVSIWGTEAQSGKSAYGDILEKKKTLPILRLLEKVDDGTTQSLLDLYNNEVPITPADAQMVVDLLEENDVYTYMSIEIEKRAQIAKNAAQSLSLTQEQKDVLQNIVGQLLPDIKKI